MEVPLIEAKELEMLILTGNHSNIFENSSEDSLNYRIARSLEAKRVLRVEVLSPNSIDMDDSPVSKFSTRLTPKGLVLYSQLVQQYDELTRAD